MSHHGRLRVFCVIILVVTATACAPEPAPPPPTPTTDTTTTDTTTTDSRALTEEIWQWALGRNVWTDPDLQEYTRDLGRTEDTDVFVHSEGFSLTMDGSGAVVSVTLYNDENALGLPQSETSFSAYKGTLPMGLSWNSTATDAGAVSGNQSLGGFGSGLEYTFDYKTNDGYRLAITFDATHEADLPGALIHSIEVRSA